ncbi:MAG: hypothetical protein WAM28_04335 [Chlamydiales bacterium]
MHIVKIQAIPQAITTAAMMNIVAKNVKATENIASAANIEIARTDPKVIIAGIATRPAIILASLLNAWNSRSDCQRFLLDTGIKSL